MGQAAPLRGSLAGASGGKRGGHAAARARLPAFGFVTPHSPAVFDHLVGWLQDRRIRSEEHTSETPVTNAHLVCRLLLEKKKTHHHNNHTNKSLNGAPQLIIT